MTFQDLEAALVDDLRGVHGAHTIILYGSRARGDATPESDVDVAGFTDTLATSMQDARLWHGLYLDAFVYPTAAAHAGEPALLKLVGGKVLCDERGLAVPLLERLAAIDREPPPPSPDSQRKMLTVWARKMLARIRRGDVEADYRRHWLLFQLLEDWHTLRGEHYRGPKRALAHLAEHAPAAFAAFARALEPGAPIEALEALVGLVAASG